MRGYQAQQGREIGRGLKELRLLRDEAAENEPKRPPAPANDDSGAHRAAADPTRRAVPEKAPAPWDALPDPAPGAGRPERADEHARNTAGGDRHDG